MGTNGGYFATLITYADEKSVHDFGTALVTIPITSPETTPHRYIIEMTVNPTAGFNGSKMFWVMFGLFVNNPQRASDDRGAEP